MTNLQELSIDFSQEEYDFLDTIATLKLDLKNPEDYIKIIEKFPTDS